MIDKKVSNSLSLQKIKFILGDFFEKEVENQITGNFDLILASYSLCFNTQEKIEKNLPFYLKKINPDGVFLLYDFSYPKEEVVSKRQNLWGEMWFLNLLNNYFNCFEIESQELYEKEHDHTHHIFQLVARIKNTEI